MDESWNTRLKRWGFNWFPAYRSTGARIEYIASNWQEVRIRLPLNWHTRNYVGTIFGGSMYAAVNPIHMVMLIKLLGPGYEVRDKAAIRAAVAQDGRTECKFAVDLTDKRNRVCFSCEKLLSN
jgi:acyl-coenzyme A thioesterase PaaI-like protein